MTSAFFDLTPSADPDRWSLPITTQISVGPPGKSFMFGGIGMAAAVKAIEQSLSRPVICATAQYLSFARPPSVLDLRVEVAASGRHTSQVRVAAQVDGATIFAVSAAVGARPGAEAHQWAQAPDVPPPQDCAPAILWPDQGGNLNGRIDVRMAPGRFGEGPRTGKVSADGRMVAWIRPRDRTVIGASDLAVFADYIPSGIGVALGRTGTGGNSLDNTLRFHRLVPTEWALCSIRIASVNGEIAHGDMQIFAENGVLMASASQTMIVRTVEY